MITSGLVPTTVTTRRVTEIAALVRACREVGYELAHNSRDKFLRGRVPVLDE